MSVFHSSKVCVKLANPQLTLVVGIATPFQLLKEETHAHLYGVKNVGLQSQLIVSDDAAEYKNYILRLLHSIAPECFNQLAVRLC